MTIRDVSPWAWLVLVSLLQAPVAGQAPKGEHDMHRLHKDPKAYIAALEDPKRDGYQKPHEVMQALAVREGEIIADIGAGSGYFALRLAHHVGHTGRVYAVDISPDMIRHLQARIRDMGLLNVTPVLAQPDDPLLPQPVDRFLFVNVWHHVDDQSGYLAGMRKRLKPGGQVVMIDFHKRELPVGPPLAMKIAREDLIRQMETHGFRVAGEHTFLPYQYFLVFEPASPSASRAEAEAQAGGAKPPGPQPTRPSMSVKPTTDFEVTGAGDNPAWKQAEWVSLRKRQADGHPYDTRFRMLYSPTGLYVHMEATDRTLTATMTEDFLDLWNEDVFEMFLWTDERYPVYFEYQISPLNHELAILIPNFGGQFLGWRPWHYEGDRLTRKATRIVGGEKRPHAAIEAWHAEYFIPYALLRPLQNVPPKPGTRWRGNFYRMDYDDGRRTQWEWAPVGQSFHEFEKFGDIVFEDR